MLLTYGLKKPNKLMNLVDNSEQYVIQQRILIAVDCIIFGYISNKIKLLLVKRKVQPAMNEWSLIGAFIKSLRDGSGKYPKKRKS